MEVTINQLLTALRRVKQRNEQTHRYQLVPFILSGPGVGKSSVIYQLAEEWGMDVVDARLSTMSVLDLRGVPYKEEQPDGTVETKWARPDFARQDGNYILFLDELTSAPPALQAAAYEIMLDRRVGGHKIPDDVFIVAAGNRAEDRGVVFETPVPLRNRLMHFTVAPNVDDFVEYGMRVGLDESILAFLKFNPSLLFKMPSGNQMAFPTPRTWEFLSSYLGYNPELFEVQGIIGEGAAHEFMSFRAMRNQLPDVPALLKKGEVWTTKELSLQYAFTFSLARHFLNAYDAGTKAQRKKLLNNWLTIVVEQPEEMMVLSFFLVKNHDDLIVDLYHNEIFQKDLVNKVKSVLSGN